MTGRTARTLTRLGLVALAGCATYEPDPIDPFTVLADLESRAWPAAGPESGPRAAGPRRLAAFAVTTNPDLIAARSRVGVRRALLVEAGLLPDPEVGWDAMDVLAVELTGGTASSTEVLSGLGLMLPLPRPGERSARVGAAEWRVEEARRRVAVTEWTLTRDVFVAFEEVRAARALLAQTRALADLAEATHRYFVQARDAGAATGIEANLALGELHAIRLDLVGAEGRDRRARQQLNALLGLRPDYPLELDAEAAVPGPVRGATEDLAEYAVEHRPDLAALLAGYRAAEEELRLAYSTRFPRVALGTGIRLTVPVFTRFGDPAIATATARRDQLRHEFTAAVHAARREIAAARTALEEAEGEEELVRTQLLPNAEESLQLSREALAAGEATLLETILLQRALVAARTRSIETRAERSKRAWTLLAASGLLLTNTEDAPATETPEEAR